MVKVRSLEQTQKRAAYSCLRAYLEGSKTLNWFLEMIRYYGAHGRVLSQAFDQLGNYGDADRYSEAKAACEDRGWI